MDQATPDQIIDMKCYIAAAAIADPTDEELEAGECIMNYSDEKVLEIIEANGGYEGPEGWVQAGAPSMHPNDNRALDPHISMTPHGQWAL